MTSPVPLQAATADEHVFLIGRPPLGEFLGFIRVLAVDGHLADQGQLAAEWRTANDHVRQLETTEAGLADNPPTTPLESALLPLRDELRASSIFQRSFAIVPSEVVMVELDRLVVFQKFINLEHVQRLQVQLGPTPTSERIFRFALSVAQQLPPVRVMQTNQNEWTFISPSTDFRLLEAAMLTPAQVSGHAHSGPPVAVIGLMVGYGSNLLNAVSVENRLILANGSHRAFALRDAGITHVPCLVQRVTRREELEVIGSAEIAKNADLYLRSPRPPLLKDYFDPALRKLVPVHRKNRVVKIQYGLEQTEQPAS